MKLMYLNGAMTGHEVELIPSGTTIGRETDNAIQLMMDGVSRYHARIERDPSLVSPGFCAAPAVMIMILASAISSYPPERIFIGAFKLIA